MGVIEVNRNPSRRDLMVFGLVLLVFSALVGALFQWWRHEPGIARAIWAGSAALAAVYFAVPPLRRPIFLGWSHVTFPIGYVLSHVILGVVYYVFFTAFGLIMRLVGYDPLQRKLDPTAKSYWTPHDPHTSVERYFRQS